MSELIREMRSLDRIAVARMIAARDALAHEAGGERPPAVESEPTGIPYPVVPRAPDATKAWDIRHAHPLLLAGLAAVVLGMLTLFFHVAFPGDAPDPRTVFSPQEVRAFLAYRQGLQEGAPYRPQPARYGDWLRAGRPGGRVPE